MKIILNGKETEITPGATIATMLTMKGYTGDKIAVAIGTKVVPRAEWQITSLNENDKVTIISAVRGG